MCFSFCQLSRFLRISQGCFHRRISQDCYTSFVSSSVSSSFPACSFRKRTNKFRIQGRAWGRICFGRCSFGRICFGRMSSWKVWSCRIIIFNTSVTAVRDCSVCGWSWSVLCRRTETPHQQNISVVGKNSSDQESSLDICRSSCKVERYVDNTRSIVNRHQFSRVVCDPCFTCTTDIGLVAHRRSYSGAAACD
jgi:hypothetical protein